MDNASKEKMLKLALRQFGVIFLILVAAVPWFFSPRKQ